MTASGSLGHLPLPWRVFAGNAVVLGVAVLVLAVTPARVTVPTRLDEAVVIVGGITAILLTNLVLLRRAFAPLGRLTELMRRVEPLEPGQRIPVYGDDAEVVELTRAFNEMLDRLEEERRDSVRRSLAAQEGERRRVAQELHDEIGQMLTAIVLRLDRLERLAPDAMRTELAEAREDARASLEDVRRIAQRLRPEALEDLGLASALEALCDRVAEDALREVARRAPDVLLVDYDLPNSDGLALCWDAKALEDPPRVLIYSAFTRPRLEVTARVAGADGVLDKTAPAEELFEQVRLVAGGGKALATVPPQLIERCVAELEPDEIPLFGMAFNRVPVAEIAAVAGLDVDTTRARLRALVIRLQGVREATAV